MPLSFQMIEIIHLRDDRERERRTEREGEREPKRNVLFCSFSFLFT